MNPVLETKLAAADAKPDCEWLCPVNLLALAGLGVASICISQIFSGAGTVIGLVRAQQFGQGGLVGGATVGLIKDGFVPVQGMGFQGAENLIGGSGRFPKRVNIFNTDHPLALMMTGIQIAG